MRSFMRRLSAFVVTTTTATVLFGPVPAQAQPMDWQITRLGADLANGFEIGSHRAISDDGRYLVTSDGSSAPFTWHDTLTGQAVAVGHLPSDVLFFPPVLQYLPGQSPDLATTVQVGAKVSGTGYYAMYTDTIGGPSAVPSGPAWLQQLAADQAAAGCLHQANPTEILQSSGGGVVVRVYTCAFDPRDQDNGRTSTYLWHPASHSFEFISVVPPDVPVSAGYSAFADASDDGRYVVYDSVENHPDHPGQFPYSDGRYLWDRLSDTRHRLPIPTGADSGTAQILDFDAGPRIVLSDRSGGLTFYDPVTATTQALALPDAPVGVPLYADPYTSGVFSRNGRFYLAALTSLAQPCCTRSSSLVLYDLHSHSSELVIADTVVLPFGADLRPFFISDDGTRLVVQTRQSLTPDAHPFGNTYLLIRTSPDTTPPTLIGQRTPAPNAWGWHNTSVTVDWTAHDDTDGFLTAPPATLMSSEGADLTAVSAGVCDAAGNCAHGAVPAMNIDLTAPTVIVTGVQNGATYIAGNVPTAGCVTSDLLSGVRTEATPVLVENGDATFTVHCAGALDQAGNSASAETTYTVSEPVYHIAANSKAISNNNAIAAVVDTAGILAGETVTVAIATGTFAGPVGCADSKGNAYAVAADRNTGNGRLFLCSAVVTSALTAGDTITATYPGFSGLSVISVNAISHAATTGTLLQTRTNSGNNANPTSGGVASGGPGEVIFGVIAHNSTPAFSAGAGLTLVGAVSGGSGSGMRTLSPVHILAPAAGVFAATGSLTGGQQWRAAIITLQAP